MKRIEKEFNSIIRILFVITIICGIIFKVNSNEIIINISRVVGEISFGFGIIMIILKDETKDRLLQKEGWV